MPDASAATTQAPTTPDAPTGTAKATESIGRGNRAAAIAQLDAAAKSDGDPVAEQAAPEAAEPVAAPVAPGGAKDAHKSARERAAADYAEFARRTKQLEASRGERQRRTQEDAQRRAEADAHAKQIAAARLADEDPFAYLESRGVTAEELVKRGVARGSPEAKIEAKLAELEQWKAAQAKADQERQAQAAHAQAQQQYFTARKYLEELVDKHHEMYPTLDSLAPSYVSYQAYQKAKEYFEESGEVPDERVTLQILAFVERTEHDARAERLKRRAPAVESSQMGSAKRPAPPTAPAPSRKGMSLRDQRRERGLAILDRAAREAK